MKNDRAQRAEERAFDLLNNEGGSGYNPCREERLERERLARIESEKTLAGRHEKIIKTILSLDREYDGQRIAELKSELAEIDAALEAEFLAEWNLAETKSRREHWNGLVRSGKIKSQPDAFAAAQKLGWGLKELRKAIELHQL